jgi:hypothetical protein
MVTREQMAIHKIRKAIVVALTKLSDLRKESILKDEYGTPNPEDALLEVLNFYLPEIETVANFTAVKTKLPPALPGVKVSMPLIFQWFIGNDTMIELGHYDSDKDCFIAGETMYKSEMVNAWCLIPETPIKIPFMELVAHMNKGKDEVTT